MSEPGPSDAGPSDRPRGTIRIGSIAGSDVLVSASWFLVAVLIAVLIAPRVEAVAPGLGGWRYLAGLAFAVLLYLSVLLHEASHAFAARHYGYQVESITLHFLGGATQIGSESRTPRHEFVIAVVGPITSLAVGGAALLALPLAPGGLLQLALEALAFANLFVGLLNLVPGLPLDGGRVMKAGVWRLTGSADRGSLAAGWSGRVAAVAMLGWPVLLAQFTGRAPGVVDFVLAGVVAAFLWTGASAVIGYARLRSRLPWVEVRALARRLALVPAEVSVAEAIRRAQEAGAGGIVTLDRGNRPEGLVSEAALQRMPVERRPWAPVSVVARTLESGMVLSADLQGSDLLAALQAHPASEYLLLEADGRPYGILAISDVERALAAGSA